MTPRPPGAYRPVTLFPYTTLFLSAEVIHEALMAGPAVKSFACPPTPLPSRDQAADMFRAGARAHPEYRGEAPVNGLFRLLTETGPCRPWLTEAALRSVPTAAWATPSAPVRRKAISTP